MQEDIERRSIAVSVSAAKLTGRVLAKALEAALQKMRQGQNKAHAPQGRQSVNKLMGHGEATNTIPLDGETRLFDRVARRWNVDYSFHKTGPKKYLLLFKTKQADAITQCFAEYTKRAMAKTKRPTIGQRIQRMTDSLKRQRPKEHERKREAAHGDR